MKTKFTGFINGTEYNDADSFFKAYEEARKADENISASCTSKTINEKQVFDFDIAHLLDLAKQPGDDVYDVVGDLADKFEYSDNNSPELLEKAKSSLETLKDREMFCESEASEIETQLKKLENARKETETELAHLNYIKEFLNGLIEVPKGPTDENPRDPKTDIDELTSLFDHHTNQLNEFEKLFKDLFG